MTDLHTDTLAEQLSEALAPVFPQTPTFFSDSPELRDWLKSIGCRTFGFAQAREVPKEHRQNSIIIPTDDEGILPYKDWHALFRDSRVLIVPLVSFDASVDAATYTIEMLAKSKFESAVALNQSWLSLLMDRKEPMAFGGQGCDLTCKLEDDVTILKPKTETWLSPGEWESIGSYCEVGLVPMPEDFRPGFRPGYVVNGTLTVPGVAVAHHKQMHPDLRPLPTRAWELFKEIREQGLFPLKMELENSRAVHIWAGERDLSGELEEFTNRRLELVVNEMAFSTNEGVIPEHIDWNKNSQLNEGAVGIHVGLGDGVTGAHIDFICPGVDLLN